MGLPLGEVRLECDAWVDEEALRARMPLVAGEVVTAERLALARRVLDEAQIFRRIGAGVHAEGGLAVVVFRLERRRVIAGVSVRGYDRLNWREVHRVLRLRTGSFYDREAVEAARQRLATRYRRAGYPNASVTYEVDERPGEADVDFAIDEGAPLLVAAAVVAGETGMAAAELQEELSPLVGKPYERALLRQGDKLVLGRLREAGYYDAEVDGEWVQSGPEAGVLWYTVIVGESTKVEFHGNVRFSPADLLALMDFKTRLVVTGGAWRELARRITRAYEEAGYYRVRVRWNIVEGEPRRVVYTIDEGRRFEVRRVRFAGNAEMPAGELEAQMNTRPARWLPWPRQGAFVRSVLDEDLRRLWYFYREQGFASAEIVDAPVSVDDDTGEIVVTVVVDEGPRTVVEAVEKPDLGGLGPAAKPAGMRLTPGAPLRPADLEADAASIRAVLQRDGYGEATVEPVVTRHRGDGVELAEIGWHVERGPRREIGAVLVQGNVDTRDQTILGQLPFAPGDPLDATALQRGQDAVYQLGTYRSVAVQPLGPPAPVQDVGVSVVPRPPGAVQWGAGYNTRDGITGFGEISYQNLGHRARRVMLYALGSVIPNDLSQTQFLSIAGYREPQFLDSAWQWNSEVVGERNTKNINQYFILRGNVGSGLTRELMEPRLKGGGEAQLQYADTFAVKPVSLRGVDAGDSYTTALSPFLVFDGRDDSFVPTGGVFETLRLRYAFPGASTVQFGKVDFQHSQALPLAPWLTFAYSARAAYGIAISGAPVLPIRERFFLGGSTSVRGYDENSIGPVDPVDTPVGGDLAGVLSLELRVPIPILDKLSAAVFNDNGALFLTQCGKNCERNGYPGPDSPPIPAPAVRGNAVTWSNIRQSVGPGLRYLTPVGPISLDYGFKINRRAGESVGAVAFNISGTF